MTGVSPRVVTRQRVLLRVAYTVGRLFRGLGRRVSWIIAAEEIAGMVAHIGMAVPGGLTVVRQPHPFYEHHYDIVLQRPHSRIEVWRRLYLGALVLGWWSARAKGVVYVGAAGLLDGPDERRAEFAFLRDRGRAVVCCFTGNDIRSPALMRREAERTGEANIGSILFEQGSPFSDLAYEDARRERAAVADRYANAVITARVDQMSYLAIDTEPFLYFYPDDLFVTTTAKFEALDPLVVVHAPSKQLLKGTPVVQAVMARLQARHPHVEYRQLEGLPNEQVIAALDDAHIVLNQFHAQMPGLFGIEAMARACVMVCSANPEIETDLAEANDAWVVATPRTLEARLEELVTAPKRLEEQAMRGLAWARAHASGSASAERLRAILDRAVTPTR